MAVDKRRARWMGPMMIVVAGIAAGAPVRADGIASDDVVEIPGWQAAFADAGVAGTIVLKRLGDRRSFVSDLDEAGRGLVPAATFDIPHALIALETGVLQDTRVLGGGGRALAVRDTPGAPKFRELAGSVGEGRMRDWLVRLGYGNADISGGIDRFWQDGALRVTPAEQAAFVERLLLQILPASARAQSAARKVVPAEPLACGAVLRAKTGWAAAGWNGSFGRDLGWSVGWVELPREVWVFATVVEGERDDVDRARRDVTADVLRRAGVLGSDGCAGTAEAALQSDSATAAYGR